MRKQPKYTPMILRLTLLIAMFMATPVFAQDPPDFEDDVNDEPTVPIDGSYIVLALLAGVGLGISTLRKSESIVK